MKNHIIFKFLAVLLCAASLLGAVGSAVGVFALTETDLYDRTAEQALEEEIRETGLNFAEYTARRYASTTLGDMPNETVDQVLGFGKFFKAPYYGYKLIDEDGTELIIRENPYQEEAQTYSYKVSGQYLHLVEKTYISKELEKQEEQEEVTHSMDTPYDVLVDEIPAEGATVSEIQFSFPDSSHGASGGEMGTVFRNEKGAVILRAPYWSLDEAETLVTAISLRDMTGKLIYEARSERGVGLVSYAQDGTMIFTAFLPYDGPVTVAELPAQEMEIPAEVTEAAAEEETVAVTEAPAETVEETVPVTEVPVETVAEEPVLINGKPLEEYQINRDSYYDGYLNENVTVSYVYVPMPEMTVSDAVILV